MVGVKAPVLQVYDDAPLAVSTVDAPGQMAADVTEIVGAEPTIIFLYSTELHPSADVACKIAT
jgi:hypothetical protein